MATEVAEIFVGPGRPDLAIKAGLGMLAVPAKPKTVAIDARGRFQRLMLCAIKECAGAVT
jgi:hypothetical protein